MKPSDFLKCREFPRHARPFRKFSRNASGFPERFKFRNFSRNAPGFPERFKFRKFSRNAPGFLERFKFRNFSRNAPGFPERFKFRKFSRNAPGFPERFPFRNFFRNAPGFLERFKFRNFSRNAPGFPAWICLSGLLLCCPLLTGCSSESIADRTYTQAIGLTYNAQEAQFCFYTQRLQQTSGFSSVTGSSITEILRCAESVSGGKLFIGHTELLCLDGTCTMQPAEELLFGQRLSPACKVFYASPETYFQETDSSEMVHHIRMAEQNGLLSVTELSTVLREWQGIWETALVPAQSDGAYPSLVLLHKDGTCTTLSEAAANGMYWLRQNAGGFSLTMQTADGQVDVFIRNCRLKKSVRDGVLYYALCIHTRGSTEVVRQQLARQIKQACEAAVCEMQAARADVIHMQDMLEQAHLPAEKDDPPEIMLSVVVK